MLLRHSSRSLSILAYHRVLPTPDPLLPDIVCADDFERQMKAVARWFNFLPLGEAISLLRRGELPPRAVSLTFDDGYADNASVALPILKRLGIPATFFIATSFLNGGRMWNDTVIEVVRRSKSSRLKVRGLDIPELDLSSVGARRAAIDTLLAALKYYPLHERQKRVDLLSQESGDELPSDLMMTSDQVKSLVDHGMTVGAHTVNHPILAKLDPEQASKEILESKIQLEAMTGTAVTLFAYPNGKPNVDYLPHHARMVREAGFEAAVSTGWGVATANSDPYQLPRFTPWDKTPGRFLLRLMRSRLQRQSV